MKKYNTPVIENYCILTADVITLSPVSLRPTGDADIELEFPHD